MKTRTSRTRTLRRRHRKALTLMAIMLVLVILGILGSMAAMFVQSAQKNGMRKAARAEISSFETAIDRYLMDMYTNPTQQDGLQALLTKPSSDTNNRALFNVAEGSEYFRIAENIGIEAAGAVAEFEAQERVAVLSHFGCLFEKDKDAAERGREVGIDSFDFLNGFVVGHRIRI